MIPRWLWRAMKDDLGMTDAERMAVAEEVGWKKVGHPRAFIAFVAASVPSIGALVVTFMAHIRRGGGGPPVPSLLLVVPAGLVSLVLFYWLQRSWTVSLTLDELHKRGFRLCRKCGYYLRGHANGVSTCPECGAALKS